MSWSIRGALPWLLTGIAAGLVACQSALDLGEYVFAPGGADAGVGSLLPAGSGMGCDVSDDCLDECSGCVIDGQCFEPGVAEPSNSCRVCDPSRSPTAWSERQGSCDDGLFCTVGDVCEQGRCTGGERTCDDRIACNGASTCDEAADGCSTETNLCPSGTSCDAVTGQCVSRCEDCGIAGICVPNGGSAPGNPCLVCDTALSVTEYTPAEGRVCGEMSGACSQQATCNAAGDCVPNHLPEGTLCGAPAGDGCDPADTCDGAGVCVERRLADDAACEDLQYCTVGDTCQGGVCASGPARECSPEEQCNEVSDACECTGCLVDGACLASGARDANPCLVCDPARNAAAFSVDVGAACGAGPTECSAQDTCDASGNCLPNHSASGLGCGSRLSSTCNQADSCDGNGGCNSRIAANGTPCQDGLSCTSGDACQEGICATGRLIAQCDINEVCSEATRGCTCAATFTACPEDGVCRRLCPTGGDILP